MSPEQLRSAKEVDARADVWSLGIIMFELLTNTLPFHEESMAQLCVSVMLKPLPNIQDFTPEIPNALRVAIERATAKEPNERFADVAGFAAAIAPFGSEDAARSLRRVERISKDCGNDLAATRLPEPQLAATQVDGRSDVVSVPDSADSALTNTRKQDSDPEEVNSKPDTAGTSVAANAVQAPGLKLPIQRDEWVPQQTLDGVATLSKASSSGRNWKVAAIAGAAAVLGATLVVVLLERPNSVITGAASSPSANVGSTNAGAPVTAVDPQVIPAPNVATLANEPADETSEPAPDTGEPASSTPSDAPASSTPASSTPASNTTASHEPASKVKVKREASSERKPIATPGAEPSGKPTLRPWPEPKSPGAVYDERE
jgi:serine/threonine-protein kinase